MKERGKIRYLRKSNAGGRLPRRRKELRLATVHPISLISGFVIDTG
jgi:hypothetical protein